MFKYKLVPEKLLYMAMINEEKYAPIFDYYDKNFVPRPFGLRNTGAICHFNSLLQALVSCPSIIKATLLNPTYMNSTRTGKAFFNFVNIFATCDGSLDSLHPSIEVQSSAILQALCLDLNERNPEVKFGSSQESASEGLVLLLDMIEIPSQRPSPLGRLFEHQYKESLFCKSCKNIVSEQRDISVQFNMFYLRNLANYPTSSEEFSKALMQHTQITEDYFCKICNKKVTSYRIYSLAMVPEVIVCLFNIYGIRDHNTPTYQPSKIIIKGKGGSDIIFNQVAQVIHSGSLQGGHYIARTIRKDNQLFDFNDSSIHKSDNFHSSPNTYLAIYHVVQPDILLDLEKIAEPKSQSDICKYIMHD